MLPQLLVLDILEINMSIWQNIAVFLCFGSALILAHYFVHLLAIGKVDEAEAVETAVKLFSLWLVFCVVCLLIVFGLGL